MSETAHAGTTVAQPVHVASPREDQRLRIKVLLVLVLLWVVVYAVMLSTPPPAPFHPASAPHAPDVLPAPEHVVLEILA